LPVSTHQTAIIMVIISFNMGLNLCNSSFLTPLESIGYNNQLLHYSQTHKLTWLIREIKVLKLRVINFFFHPLSLFSALCYKYYEKSITKWNILLS
jgi:hypothetical protein